MQNFFKSVANDRASTFEKVINVTIAHAQFEMAPYQGQHMLSGDWVCIERSYERLNAPVRMRSARHSLPGTIDLNCLSDINGRVTSENAAHSPGLSY